MKRESLSAELKLALDAGLIRPEDSERLEQEAIATNRSPLQILLEMGLVSEETLVGLKEEREHTQASYQATVAPLAKSGGSLPPNQSFPVPNWDRYQWQGFLGQGGMGRVFLAYDPRLMRKVAIKFLREEQAGVASRLVREARAQARVQHDRVCKVYEVEEIAGKVYIAMQYIQGQSLAQSRDLDLRQKVQIVRQAAEGVHAAHDAGLIHRDIKPGNLMVERLQDGTLRPFVMDFGLAYLRDENETQTQGVGTPHFMAPEQALGKENLDPRTDVYALGATLYWCLTGSPPISGSNSLDILSRIPTQEPVRPWELNPEIPRDLGLILLKCLEKEPGRRYGSAAALAKDLDLFLNGQAIEARATDMGYRLRKSLVRHKVWTAIAITVMLFLCTFLLWSWRMSRNAALRETYVRDFTQHAEEIEAMVRYTHMMPLHDIGEEKKAVADKVNQIRRLMDEAGPQGANAGNYAMGRGFLALNRPGEAQHHLELAWNNGFRDPPVAYAIARALGARYRTGVEEAAVVTQSAGRANRLRKLEERFRDPALLFLAQVPSEGSRQPDYLEALVAFYENRLDRALETLASVIRSAPWFYEAHLLEGDIYQAQARALVDKGDREGALGLFQQGSLAYERASLIAPSDPRIYLSWANLCTIMVRMALYGGGEMETPYRQGLSLLEKAMISVPDHSEAHVQLAFLHSFLAENRQNTGGENEGLLDLAAGHAQKALVDNPDRGEVHRLLGHIFNQRAVKAERETRDPRPFLTQAIAAYERVPESARDANFYTDLGNAHTLGGRYLQTQGLDPSEQRQKSMAAFRKAIALNPKAANPYINLGVQLLDHAQDQSGETRLSGLDDAADTFTTALTLNPRQMVAFYYLGLAYRESGILHMARGRDPSGHLQAAVDCQKRAAAINGQIPHFPQAESVAWYDLAKYRWQSGQDWEPALMEARAGNERSLENDPKFGPAHMLLGLVHVQWSRFLHESGQNPEQHLALAFAAFDQAETHLPNFAGLYFNRAMAHHLAGQVALDSEEVPQPQLEKARRAMAKALALNPNEAEFHFGHGKIETLVALWRAQNSLDPSPAFREASCAFQEALDRKPENTTYLFAFADHCYRRGQWLAAKGRAAESSLRQGLALISQVRCLGTDHGKIDALQGGLNLLLAEQLGPDPQAEQYRSVGLTQLNEALARKRELKHRWGHLLGVGKTESE